MGILDVRRTGRGGKREGQGKGEGRGGKERGGPNKRGGGGGGEGTGRDQEIRGCNLIIILEDHKLVETLINANDDSSTCLMSTTLCDQTLLRFSSFEKTTVKSTCMNDHNLSIVSLKVSL